MARYKVNPDFFWLGHVSSKGTSNLPVPNIIAAEVLDEGGPS